MKRELLHRKKRKKTWHLVGLDIPTHASLRKVRLDPPKNRVLPDVLAHGTRRVSARKRGWWKGRPTAAFQIQANLKRARREGGAEEGELSRHSSVLTWQRTILGCVMLHNVPRSATWRLLHIPIMDYASAKSPLRMRIASDASQRQLFKKRFLCFFTSRKHM